MFHFNNRYGPRDTAASQSLPLGQVEDDEIGLNISYKNYFIDDKGAVNRRKYGGDLLNQIEQNALRKKLEKEKQKADDLKEELRLMREREKLREEAIKEERKRNEELFQRKKENERIISSYSVMSHPRAKRAPMSNIYWKEMRANPFLELLHRRKKEQEEFNTEMLDMLGRLSAFHTKNMEAIDKEIGMMHFINLNSNEYKSKYLNEIGHLKEEIQQRKSLDHIERMNMYRKYTDIKHKRADMDAYLSINQCKQPVVNYRLNNLIVRAESYLNPNSVEAVNRDYDKEKYALQGLLVKNSRKVDQMNQYEQKEDKEGESAID